MGRQEDPALCRQLAPLPGQEAGAAAELDEELPFAETIGLHHLAEGLVSWHQERKRRDQIRLWGLLRFSCSPFAGQTLTVHQAGHTVSHEPSQCKRLVRPRWYWGMELLLSLSDEGWE